MRKVRELAVYQHFKGEYYLVQAIAEHSETAEKMVVYQALYPPYKTYVRPYVMFNSEVDHEKYPDVKQKYRFKYVGHWSNMKDITQANDICPKNWYTGEGITPDEEIDWGEPVGEEVW